jgi:phosphomannomutase
MVLNERMLASLTIWICGSIVVYYDQTDTFFLQNLSFKTADEHGSTVILANDPDADRLAVAEKQPT